MKKKGDRIVSSVVDKFQSRSEAGIKKYNTTLERTDLKTLDWINHLQEELMDATLYSERLKTDVGYFITVDESMEMLMTAINEVKHFNDDEERVNFVLDVVCKYREQIRERNKKFFND